MEPLFFELAEILARQGQLVKLQLNASQEQNAALRDFDTEKLDQAVKRLEELSAQMAELDSQREKVQQRLEKELGLKPGTPLSMLLPSAPLELVFKLKELTAQLKKDLQQLARVNEINNILTRQAMQLNEALLAIFKSGGNAKTYQNSGQVKDSGCSPAVLNKTV